MHSEAVRMNDFQLKSMARFRLKHVFALRLPIVASILPQGQSVSQVFDVLKAVLLSKSPEANRVGR